MPHNVSGIHYAEKERPRVSGKANLHKLAMSAFKNIPEAQPMIQQIFKPQLQPKDILPVPQRGLKMHTGFFSV